MSEKELLDSLVGMEFFRGVEQQYLQQIATMAKAVHFAEGKIIFREGDPALKVHFLVRGSVSLEVCARHRLPTHRDRERGRIVGVVARAGTAHHDRHRTRLNPVDAIEINGSQILALCQHDPRFGYEFMRRAAFTLARR